MQRTSPVVITGWRAILLAPIALPIAILGGLFGKTRGRTPDEVVAFLRDFIDGTGGEWDWDEFECVPITDPRLEAIRKMATTPGADLRQVLAQAEAIRAAE